MKITEIFNLHFSNCCNQYFNANMSNIKNNLLHLSKLFF